MLLANSKTISVLYSDQSISENREEMRRINRFSADGKQNRMSIINVK